MNSTTNSIPPISRPPSSHLDLTSRVAVVTGAAGWIGGHITLALAAAGAAVAVFDVIDVSRPVADLRDAGYEAVGAIVNVTDQRSVSDALGDTKGALGRIDILVNNAGAGLRTSFAELSIEDMRAQLDANLLGAIICSQAVHPIMRLLGGGKIVNVSSISARTGGVRAANAETGEGRSGAVYAAAKGGLLAFTRWIAAEWGRDGILVNAICPGPIRSPRTDGFEYDLSAAALPALGDPRDVAEAVAFLASPMSNHVTGQTLNVDGGLRMD